MLIALLIAKSINILHDARMKLRNIFTSWQSDGGGQDNKISCRATWPSDWGTQTIVTQGSLVDQVSLTYSEIYE